MILWSIHSEISAVENLHSGIIGVALLNLCYLISPFMKNAILQKYANFE